jgi:uncharacterized protein (TIGR03437 family)
MQFNTDKLILLAGAVVTCFGQASYTSMRIPFPANTNAYLVWISDDSRSGVGAEWQGNVTLTQCFTYQDGNLNVLPTPGTSCSPVAVAAGVFVARLATEVFPTGAPAYFTSSLMKYTNGQFTPIALPAGVYVNVSFPGLSVNKSGQIAGTFSCNPSNPILMTIPCAYSVSSDGTFSRLPDLGGLSGATAINDNGDIAGWVSPAGDNASPSERPVIWPHGGGMIDLDALAGRPLGLPVAMNSKGQIAGGDCVQPTTNTGCAFFYDPSAKVTSLKVPGASVVRPVSVNENGQVVGTYNVQGGDGSAHPFYYDYTSGLAVDLNAVGTDLPASIVLTQPWEINNAGQILMSALNSGQPIATAPVNPLQFLLTPSTGATAPLAPVVTAVVNAASAAAGISSSSLITIQGANLSKTTRGWGAADFVGGNLPTQLDGVSVMVNGLAAYPNYISPTQINIVTPDDPTTGLVQVTVSNSQGTSKAFSVLKSELVPAFFTVGSKYISATHANGTPVGPPSLGSNYTPAAPGETIQLYGTGFGAVTTPAGGSILTSPAMLVNPVTVTFDGFPAVVTYAGMVANGLDQVNVTVPTGLFADGDVFVQATVSAVKTNAFLAVPLKN